MKKVLCFICMWTIHLHSLPVQQIQATEVHFEGKFLHLKGDVKIVLELGSITCDETRVVLESDTTSSIAETIDLKGNIHILFTDTSEIFADEGTIQCNSLEAHFFSHPPQKVRYMTWAPDGEGKVPIRATSGHLYATIHQTERGYTLSSLRGEGVVHIEQR